jgi:hypothetical protein
MGLRPRSQREQFLLDRAHIGFAHDVARQVDLAQELLLGARRIPGKIVLQW